MIRLELRVEYAAYEITETEFDSAIPSPTRALPGLVWRDETRTVRMMTETEREDDCTEQGHAPDKRPTRKRDYEPNTAATPGPCSYYGIGCWIVCKNGRPIAIMSKQKLAEVYRIAP